MDEVPGLKLIQAVDPTKIKVAINEKFSKLTLSSNKKKLLAQNFEPTDPVEVEKRRSASRNLLSELCEENVDSNKKDQSSFCVNAILRSSSLSSENSEENLQRTETLTEVGDSKTADQSNTVDTMERLQISEDFCNQQHDDVEELTKKVSVLAVSNIERQDTTQSVPTIDIVSSSEDEHVDEDEESAIYVSDTSVESNIEKLLNDYDFMITSDLQTSAETDVPQMPCTLSNERADRIQAFLLDVSKENKNLHKSGRPVNNSIIINDTSKNETVENRDENFLASAKAKLIATADTESMTPTEGDFSKDVNLVETNKKNFALDDTEIMSESAKVVLQPEESSRERCLTKINEVSENDKRFANDDTEVNTTSDSLEKSCRSNEPAIEDSVVIPETSSDDINSSFDEMKKTTNENQELIPSEEVLIDSVTQNSVQHSKIGLSVGSINISAKINIKLQINAGFSSSEEESDDKDEHSSNDSYETSKNSEGVVIESNESEAEEETIADKAKQVSEIAQTTKQKAGVTKDDHVQRSPNCNKEQNVEENDLNFMSNAQKLLTELYGNSWQTPEVIRTLKISTVEGQNKSILSATEKKSFNNRTNLKGKSETVHKNQPEESGIADFSMFRLDIVQTNLDSTRLTTPKPSVNKKLFSNNGLTEPRSYPKKNSKKDFKIPQSEFKKKSRENILTRTRRPENERWRKLIDSESEPDDNNITDDEEVDQTAITDDNDEEKSNASDSPWEKSAYSISSDDSHYETPKRNATKTFNKTKPNIHRKKLLKSPKNNLIYLDLSKDEVTFVEKSPNHSPPANKDENFRKHLSELLSSCTYQARPKLEATPTSTGKSKRRLFTVNFGNENVDDSITAICRGETPKQKTSDLNDDNLENVRFNGDPIPRSFNIFNKHLEAVKTGKPVYKITPKRVKDPHTAIASREEGTPFSRKEKNGILTPSKENKHKLNDITETPSFKYGFLKSLDVCVGKSLCHPDALIFRENYRQKKEDLARILYELYNRDLFNNNLNVPIVWNKKLLNTAGRCINKKKLGQRLSVVELSDKVLTSADRLRCTLIHELCHAATWIFSGEGGHGAKWKKWARRANSVFPDLPKIGVCHQYDIEYKYTYKCTLCAAKSYYHSKSKKVENIRCSYCYGAIEIFLNKKDKDGNIMPTPVKEPTGFAKFVKENYQQYKRPDMKHAEVMKLLSNEFAALKVTGNAK